MNKYNTVNIEPIEPYYPGALYWGLGLIGLFVCLPVGIVLIYIGYSENDKYGKLSDSEKREYQKKTR